MVDFMVCELKKNKESDRNISVLILIKTLCAALLRNI